MVVGTSSVPYGWPGFHPRALKQNWVQEKKNSPRSASSRCSAAQAPPRPPRFRPDRRQTARSKGRMAVPRPESGRIPRPGAGGREIGAAQDVRDARPRRAGYVPFWRRAAHFLEGRRDVRNVSRTWTQRGVEAPLVDRERGRRRLFSICRACLESVVYGQTCMESRWSAGRHGRSGFVRVDAYSGCGPAFSSSRDVNHPPPAVPSR